MIRSFIRSFADRDYAERLARRERVRRFQAIEGVALRKLAMLDAAAALDDLKVPPGNPLEALRGDRVGRFSIRVNDQYQLCCIAAEPPDGGDRRGSGACRMTREAA